MLIVGNWKMTGSAEEVAHFAHECLAFQKHKLVMALPFPYLSLGKALLQKKNYALAGQTCSAHSKGPWTGQISASMLVDVGCSYVILGHTERRGWETTRIIYQQIMQARDSKIVPIVCMYDLEDWEDMVSLLPENFFSKQGKTSQDNDFYIAYEPAVGQDQPPDQAGHTLDLFRKKWPHLTGNILYGGAVNHHSAPSLKEVCDGFLVGRASWCPKKWNDLLSAI